MEPLTCVSCGAKVGTGRHNNWCSIRPPVMTEHPGLDEATARRADEAELRIRSNADYPTNGILAVHLYKTYESIRDSRQALAAADAVEQALDSYGLVIVDRAELSNLRREAADELARLGQEMRLDQECTCTPLPNAEGPCAWCDIHGQPSVAFEQGVAEGENSGRVFEREVRSLRAKLAEARADLASSRQTRQELADQLRIATSGAFRSAGEIARLTAELSTLKAGRAAGAVPAHVIAKVADALSYQSGKRDDWFLADCAAALRGRVGADGSGFDPKDCMCLLRGDGRHTFIAPGCKLGDFPEPSTHPPSEACMHCATPARLASADPVIDCPREECPHVGDCVRCGHDRRHRWDDGACREYEAADLDPTEVREWLDGSVDPGPGSVDDPARIAERIRGLQALVVLRELVAAVDDDHAGDMTSLWAEARALLRSES